ncbi:hypothetical protein FACS1894137_13790 [Spirochaetia bacterium]|nr:hypothetical protein FACS1894137_13790 [Spirochaetia bacterium]
MAGYYYRKVGSLYVTVHGYTAGTMKFGEWLKPKYADKQSLR